MTLRPPRAGAGSLLLVAISLAQNVEPWPTG